MTGDSGPDELRPERGSVAGAPPRWRTALRWTLLAVVMGVFSGLAAALFLAVLRLTTSGLLGGLAGHHPATTVSDGGVRAASGFGHAWALPLITAGGALIAGLIVARAAPETGGHGTDAAIDAAHERPTGTRGRVPAVKTVTAAITIGSGGSGGTEGPIAQIGGALGSGLARRTGLDGRQARTLVMSGLGAGIGAIFRTPLAGAVLAAEMLYVRGLAVEVLAPALIASVVAFGVFGLFHGYDPLFGDLAIGFTPHPRDLAMYAVLGLVCGLLGRLYASSFYAVSGLTERCVRPEPGRRRVPGWLPPAAGGFAVGLMGLAMPAVLGSGYGTAQQILSRDVVLEMSLWLVLLLPLAKIAATSLSIGTGGSGGIFGPGLVIGAAAGAATWRVTEPLGVAPEGPAVFTVVGMAACLGAIIHAPLGVTVLALEATRSPALIVPVAIAMAVACLVVGDRTLYRSQRATGGIDLLGRLRGSTGRRSPRRPGVHPVRVFGEPVVQQGGARRDAGP